MTAKPEERCAYIIRYASRRCNASAAYHGKGAAPLAEPHNFVLNSESSEEPDLTLICAKCGDTYHREIGDDHIPHYHAFNPEAPE